MLNDALHGAAVEAKLHSDQRMHVQQLRPNCSACIVCLFALPAYESRGLGGGGGGYDACTRVAAASCRPTNTLQRRLITKRMGLSLLIALSFIYSLHFIFTIYHDQNPMWRVMARTKSHPSCSCFLPCRCACLGPAPSTRRRWVFRLPSPASSSLATRLCGES